MIDQKIQTHNMKPKKGENKECEVCKTVFYVPKYRIKTAKFCSVECLNHGQYKTAIHTCLQCKKEFKDSPSRIIRKFCSAECYNENKRQYKDELSYRKHVKKVSVLNRGYSSRKSRKTVLREKNNTCEQCGYNEYDFCLDLHHIDYNPNNNAMDNIALLCCMCHKKLHKGVIQYAPKKV